MFSCRIKTRALLTLVAASLLSAGCGDEKPVGTLTGTVTYRGKPVTEMEVEVHRDGSGISTSSPLDAEGRFTVEAPIPVGTYELAVVPMSVADPAAARAMKPTPVPQRYRSRKTSGLKVEVEKGANDVVIELKD